MRTQKVMAGVLVADIDKATDFYTRLFGRPADSVPMPSCHEWHFSDAAWVQVVEDEKRGGSSSLALVVPELAAELGELRERGFDFPLPQTVPDFIRYVTLTDPEGNQITLVESLAPGT